MTTNGKCFDHGGWSLKQYGDKCPVCSGKIGRKKPVKENDND